MFDGTTSASPPPLGSSIQWVPTTGWTLSRLIAVVFVALGIALPIALIIRGGPLAQPPFLAITVTLSVGVFGGFAAGVFLLLEPVTVGFSTEGLTARYRVKQLTVGWEYISPLFLGTSKTSLLVFWSKPGLSAWSSAAGSILLTGAQGRALVNHPNAPKWPMPPEARARWIRGK